MSEHTPTTAEVRNCASDAGGSITGPEFDQWFAAEVDKAESRGYLEALRKGAEQAANYRGHPYNAAATLAMAFSMAADKMEKEG